MKPQPIRHQIKLAVAPETAFEVFADHLGEWWPLAYTFSGPQFESARVESQTGGRWLERTRAGEELSWGDVRAYERGRRIVLGFGIAPDRKPTPPERASEVEVTFERSGAAQTLVTVEHRELERHGEGWETLRQGMDSPQQGWPLILAELEREIRLRGR